MQAILLEGGELKSIANFVTMSSKFAGESIQRILRKRGISYVTLAPYSVDMEGYDVID